jgi:hypothetical protein
MSIAVESREVHRRATKQAALDHLVERLSGQFPELARDDILRALHGQYAEYENSRVRDFVPVPVERAARRQLGTTRAPRHRA